MPTKELTAEQDQAQLAIGEDDDEPYSYRVKGADVRIGLNPKRMNSESTTLLAGESGTLIPGGALYAELVPEQDGPARLELLRGVAVERDPRREVERPKDAAVRAGRSEIVDHSAAGLGAGSSSKEYVVAENTDSGLYKLQTLNLSETSGNWSENIRLVWWLVDENGNVADGDKMEANIGQLPYNFPSPVVVPADFTAKAQVVNDSGVTIDYRLNAAYTQEGL